MRSFEASMRPLEAPMSSTMSFVGPMMSLEIPMKYLRVQQGAKKDRLGK